jgi:hypothetical protein
MGPAANRAWTRSSGRAPRRRIAREGPIFRRTFEDIADAEGPHRLRPAEELDKLTAAHLEAVAAEQVSEHRAQALELLAEVSAELVKLANARAMGASARDNDPKGRR